MNHRHEETIKKQNDKKQERHNPILILFLTLLPVTGL